MISARGLRRGRAGGGSHRPRARERPGPARRAPPAGVGLRAGAGGAEAPNLLARRPERWRRRREQLALRRAWPSVAEELASTVRSGASLLQALESVADRGGASGRVVRARLRPTARGQPLTEAAARWAIEAGDPDQELLADAVHLAAVTGRADPALFETVADTLRERLALAGEPGRRPPRPEPRPPPSRCYRWPSPASSRCPIPPWRASSSARRSAGPAWPAGWRCRASVCGGCGAASRG